jgi:hypothetical protein
MKNVPQAFRASRLSETGAELPSTVSDAILGNNHQRKNRGRWAELAPGGRPVEVLAVTGDDQLAAGCQVSCSLQSMQQEQPGFASLVLPAVIGSCRFGTDGVQHAFEFDWVNGVLFSIAGSYIEVVAQLRDFGADPPAAPIPVKAGAALGFFPHSRPLRRSYVFRAVAAGATVIAPIPAFARSVQVIRSPAAAVTAQLLDRSGLVLAERNTVGDIELPIVPDSAQCNVINSSGALQAQITVVFDLWV